MSFFQGGRTHTEIENLSVYEILKLQDQAERISGEQSRVQK